MDIDLTLRPTGMTAVAQAHPLGLRVGGIPNGSGTPLVSVGDTHAQLSVQWPGTLTAPKAAGTRAVFANAAPGTDVTVESTRGGFTQQVVLKTRPAKGFSYRLPLSAQGLKTSRNEAGDLILTRKDGGRWATMALPKITDSSKTPRSAPVRMDLQRKGTTDQLVITPDPAFLTDAKTVFPLTVTSAVTAADAMPAGTTMDLGSTGRGAPKRASLSLETAALAGATVKKAELRLFGAGKEAPVEVSTPVKNKKPLAALAHPGAKGWLSADVTAMARQWASAKTPQAQVALRVADEKPAAGLTKLSSPNAAANIPVLSATYAAPPNQGSWREAGPPFLSYGGTYVVNTVTPLLRDALSDPDGDKVRAVFKVEDPATGARIGDLLTSDYVNSGQAASVTVPAGLLVSGKTYKFQTQTFDGKTSTAWSEWKQFTVDTAPPSAPVSISSTDYPSTGWVKGTGQAGTFTVKPPAGSDHHWLEWTLDGITWTKVAAGGAQSDVTIKVTPPRDGTHTLQVRSVDRADNKSEPLSYVFHAGTSGFVTPMEGERTAGRLPLAVETQAGKYDKATFSWRRSEADAWQQIPAANVTADGVKLSGWPVALSDGKNAPLVWNAAETVGKSGNVQIKADFTGPGGATGATAPLVVVFDGDGDGAATTQVGPGELNLLTGDFTQSATDASYFGMSVTRSVSSRSPLQAKYDEDQAPVFGPHWLSGTVAEASGYSHVRKVSDTAVDVMLAGGDAIHFTANATKSGWIPEIGWEELTLTGSAAGPGGFTLTDTDGAVATFSKLDAAAGAWQLSSTRQEGRDNSTSTVVSETVTVAGKKLARPKMLIAPTTAATTAACEANPATKGCRVLQFDYATATTAKGDKNSSDFGDFTGQVKQLRLWSNGPGAANATATSVATYRYDNSGFLRQQWDPRLGQDTQTQYAYFEDRLVWMAVPGEQPYTFSFDTVKSGAAPGSGMLIKVTRAKLKPGSKNETEGNATTSIVYGTPLSGDKAPYDMADVRHWGQLDKPTDATAVFPADSVPVAASGPSLSKGDYKRATVHYLNASGRTVNTASPGGGITTTEYDRYGNTVRELSAANRTLALGQSSQDKQTLTDLGIIGRQWHERAELLSTITEYSADGTRELQKFDPLHRVKLTEEFKGRDGLTLTKGTSVPARSWMIKKYDEGRPTDGSAIVKDQVTTTIAGARVQSDYDTVAEQRVNRMEYDWAKGLSTKFIQALGSLDLTTETRYDAQGRISSQIQPGATGGDATTRVTKYWEATGSGQCKGRPEWADLVCWTGPGGDISGGGDQPKQLPGITNEYGYYGLPATVTETANGKTRTTTVSYDSAGRPSKTAVSDGVGLPVPAVENFYDPVSGKPVRIVSATAGTISKDYDSLGRQISYTDADGGTTTTDFDLLGRPLKVADTSPSTVTFTYDHEAEPRGLATKVTDSVAGTFSATYDQDGSVRTEKLPGGYTLNVTEDTTGSTVSRSYTRDSDNTTVYTDTVTESVHGQVIDHAGWSNQTYDYDKAGRLAATQDTVQQVCTRRDYALDKRANRTWLGTTTAAPGMPCTAQGVKETPYSYDSADRLISDGYKYDEFGRTTALPGTATTYYVNDLVAQQTTGTKRQSWTLDPALRFRSSTTAALNGTTWSPTSTKTNHYDGDTDSPRWITEDAATGALTRMVDSVSGNLAATTSKTGDTTLQLTTIHGDVALQLPLDATKAPTALDSDEYGNPRTGQAPARYGWLGAKQRSAETPSNVTLMGARLYNPSTGRFLSLDPVHGGNANAYEYCHADPVNCTDLSGQYSYKWSFDLGFFFNSAKSVFGWVRTHFWVFPFSGCGATLSKGERCNLAYGLFPVRVTELSSTSWKFISLAGHIEGAGKWIKFSFSKSWGRVKLTVQASGANDKWFHKHMVTSFGNKVGAYTGWTIFATSISLWAPRW
ncbi:RHS repeat-associated core domain-containing protein [Streptomyces sp. NPDC001941]|uniref:RHS repeat-associated core domain-containing protein n=1 Tax=Streptomyces sp. NPDC001941 TaxID=3154659 RepID=UPI00332F92BD